MATVQPIALKEGGGFSIAVATLFSSLFPPLRFFCLSKSARCLFFKYASE